MKEIDAIDTIKHIIGLNELLIDKMMDFLILLNTIKDSKTRMLKRFVKLF